MTKNDHFYNIVPEKNDSHLPPRQNEKTLTLHDIEIYGKTYLQATKKGKFSEKNHCMEFIMISSENLASFSVISSEVAEIR